MNPRPSATIGVKDDTSEWEYGELNHSVDFLIIVSLTMALIRSHILKYLWLCSICISEGVSGKHYFSFTGILLARKVATDGTHGDICRRTKKDDACSQEYL